MTEPTLHANIDADLKDLVPAYLSNRRADLQTAIDALRIRDYPRLERLGHNIRGTGASYGFDGMTEIGSRLEHAAIERNDDALRRCIQELGFYLKSVRVSYRCS